MSSATKAKMPIVFLAPAAACCTAISSTSMRCPWAGTAAIGRGATTAASGFDGSIAEPTGTPGGTGRPGPETPGGAAPGCDTAAVGTPTGPGAGVGASFLRRDLRSIFGFFSSAMFARTLHESFGKTQTRYLLGPAYVHQ